MGGLQAAIDKRLGRVKQGITNLLPAWRGVVDNASNPASAYSMQQRANRTAAKGLSPQAAALQKAMNKTYAPGAKKGMVYGTPPGGPNQISSK